MTVSQHGLAKAVNFRWDAWQFGSGHALFGCELFGVFAQEEIHAMVEAVVLPALDSRTMKEILS